MKQPRGAKRAERRISHHGRRIRHARLMKGYTLRQLAEIVDCSESMVSKLENSRLSPSLAMLHRLAEALDTTVPDLLIVGPQDDGADPVTVFPAERFVERPAQDGEENRLVWFDRVLPFDKQGLLQVNLLHLAPGAEQPRFLQHEGEEFIFVLDGTLDVIVKDHSYPVAAGGGIFFSSMLDHRYANTGTEVVRALWVNTPPTM
ncbi:MAG: Xre family transcriptional regulator with cupin sensor [Rhodobacteraceae bacterium HLUCCA08]|nr:MAG: Xre family transcriptional regulator with cupin sensor [Rhodobacteraceae bacterium HLUCCA08]